MSKNKITKTKIYKFEQAKGQIAIPLTNDLFFKVFLEKCRPALESIICGVLDITKEDIQSIEILNPTRPGDHYDSKEMVLDMLVSLNSSKIINLEMQVVNKNNWPERTTNYIFRLSDNLKQGQNYLEMDSICHIGILDYAIFPEMPEFFSTYKLQNVHNQKLFTDKLEIYAIDMSNVEKATPDDKRRELDKWARLFKSKDWKEVQELAKESEVFKEAGEIVYKFTEDDRIRKVLEERARLDRIHDEMLIEQQRKELEAIEEKKKELEAYNKELQDTNKELQGTNKELQGANKELQDTNKELQGANKELQGANKELQGANKELQGANKELQDTNISLSTELEKYKKLLRENGIEIVTP